MFKPVFMALLVLLCSCKKNQEQKIDDFADYYSINAHYEKEHSVLKIDISLKGPLHAYAPKEPTGKPVRLEITPQNGWEPLGEAKIPEGRKEKLDLGESYVLDKDFSIEQRLKPGKGPGEAILHLQVCTNTQCDRPRTHTLSF